MDLRKEELAIGLLDHEFTCSSLHVLVDSVNRITSCLAATFKEDALIWGGGSHSSYGAHYIKYSTSTLVVVLAYIWWKKSGPMNILQTPIKPLAFKKIHQINICMDISNGHPFPDLTILGFHSNQKISCMIALYII